MRTYFVKDGREISEYFSCEQEWVNSPRSFMQRQKDIYYIDAIEPVEAFCLQINDLGYLLDHFPEMERYSRLSMGHIFGHLMERITSMRFTTAKEKYDHFLPDLQRHISSDFSGNDRLLSWHNAGNIKPHSVGSVII
ncbi:Crp/Fnr family transcriptional regulator [Dyadobacter sp. CY323]|uniref:Crp/Fnr family transcriptional regulator n=1 Tax=Dyadobacter sp. CY323 TaxID=2907302 RepID=UPI001F2C720D|nr:hypothetical protein [Dyadobacter sp. CY323]MCE6989658.1 hypothetical protein [Dyadobacter sp. CY323]